MIKGIIFDMGGVVLEVRIKGFLKKFEFITRLSKEEMYDKIMNNEDWELFDKGLIDQSDLLERIERKEGISKHILEFIAKRWRGGIRVNEDVLKIVKRLKDSDRYMVYALSNVDKVTTEEMKKRFPHLWEYFDGHVLSCDVRMRKPEKAIYDYTLKEMGLKPVEVVFIDNYPVNLPVPEKMGIKTILFKDHKQLTMDLKSLGIAF